MSWLFSQALMDQCANSHSSPEPVAASSAATCSDGEPSAQLNVMPTPHKFWRNDKTIEPSGLSRFGLTCRLLTDEHGAALLTSFRAGFPARTSASPEKAQASTEPGPECGPTWRGWLAKYDPVSSSWRTAQQSLIEDSGESLETFPRSGMTRGGLLWEQATWALHTSASVSGSWPTPTASLGTKGGRITPRKSREGGTLIEAVSARSAWPTPTVSGNYNRKGASAKSGDGLATAVLKCATPTARDWRSGKASEATMMRNSRPLSEQIGGSLNPTWVEWLMGWPLGWTALEPLGTVKYRSVQPQPSGCSLLSSAEAEPA